MTALITNIMDWLARRNGIFYNDKLLSERKDAALLRHVASEVHQKFHFLRLMACRRRNLGPIGAPILAADAMQKRVLARSNCRS